MEISHYILIAWMLLPIGLAVFIIMTRRKLRKELLTKDKELIAKDDELSKAKALIDKARNRLAGVTNLDAEEERLRAVTLELQHDISVVRGTYTEKRMILEALERQVEIYDSKLSFAELGLYEPHFEFADSEEYKARIIEVRARQKAMITTKAAAFCRTSWTVQGSRAQGETMINRQVRLTLRAFNNECEAAIANARWNNVSAMEKRISTAADAINKVNASHEIFLNADYLALKLEELYLAHEYREKLKSEKDARSEMARAEREEKRLLAETEAAEHEERRYQALLDSARFEAEAGSLVAQNRIIELEKALAAAHAETERARAMAELTKSGYVYIISNIGSFGENVVKIGLTRRLDPDDRVRELGDASVPFSFDTHAMIYSSEAPALEAMLHRKFADRRINTSNFRKEFFRVNLDEVEAAVKELAPTAAFFKDREAQQWHETIARRNSDLLKITVTSSFPEFI
jgi:hypothetical protein